MRGRFWWTGIIVSMVWMGGCGSSEEGLFDFGVQYVGEDGKLYERDPEVLFVVDANRDGIVDVEDREDLEGRLEVGGLFLANIDDDAGRCGSGADTATLHLCSDADLEEIANEEDLRDFARMKAAPIAGISPESYGVLHVDENSLERVRIYRNIDGGSGPESFRLYELGEERIGGGALRDGVEFAIAGVGLIEDRDLWDGRVELTWKVEVAELNRSFEDRAVMTQAPVILRHHLDPARKVYASNLGFENRQFRQELEAAAEAAEVRDGTRWLETWDPWAQDYFENGYMAIPGPDGPVAIQVYFRSANISYPQSLEELFVRLYQGRPPAFLREAGALVHTAIQGPGASGQTIFDPDKGFEPVDLEGVNLNDVVNYLYGQGSQRSYPEIAELIDNVMDSDTLDSFGNTEVIPPHQAPDGVEYPHGRIFRGRGASENIRPDTAMSAVLEAQGVQPTVWVETDWLIVAHVDETISFVESETERGWSVLYGNPVEAREIFEELREQGHGERLVFEGLFSPDWDCTSWNCPDLPAERTVNEILDDAGLMAASARAMVEIEAQKDVLREEVGLNDEDFVGLPFLFEDTGWGLVAYQPGMVNGISLQPDVFGPPRPFGPQIDGADPFEVRVEEILGNLGVSVEWIAAWDVYHVGMGEVHCGSNVERELPERAWWKEEGQ